MVGNLEILSISDAGNASPLIANPTVLSCSLSFEKSLNNLAGEARSSFDRAIIIGPFKSSIRHLKSVSSNALLERVFLTTFK